MEHNYPPNEKVLAIHANKTTSTLQTAANSKGGHQHTLLGLALIHPDSSYAGLSASVRCNSINVYLEMVENIINTCLRSANSPCLLRTYKLNDKFLAEYSKISLGSNNAKPYSAVEFSENMFIMDVDETSEMGKSSCTLTFYKLNEPQPRTLNIRYGM